MKATSLIVLTVVLFGHMAYAQHVFADAECAVFKTNLSRGNKGTEVATLQKWLIGEGYEIPSVAQGKLYGYFGVQTQKALTEYQKSVGMKKGLGYFGPVTRSKISAACGGKENSAPVPTASKPVSIRLLVNTLESISVSPGANLNFSWMSQDATYCYNSTQQNHWDMWRGKQTSGSTQFTAPTQTGNYVYSMTCGLSIRLGSEATSTVSVQVI